MKVKVSLRLRYTAPSLGQELMLKRDDFRVIVCKVLHGKQLSEIVIDKLRRELKDGMNGLLENGGIVDVEFTDFQPVP